MAEETKTSWARIIGLISAVVFWCVPLVWAELSLAEKRELSMAYAQGLVDLQEERYLEAFKSFRRVLALDASYKKARQYLDESLEGLTQQTVRLESSEGEVSVDSEAVDQTNPQEDSASVMPREDLSLAVTSAGEVSVDDGSDQQERLINAQKTIDRLAAFPSRRQVARQQILEYKKQQLAQQEQLLREEKQDYLEQVAIAKRAEQVRRETEKWKSRKEQLVSQSPPVEVEMTEFPVYRHHAENYYATMEEALIQSRWNTAGWNAVAAAIAYCDAVLIFRKGIRSDDPSHENIASLLLANIDRSDVDEYVLQMRGILNLKKIIEYEDRPMTRSEALYAAQNARKLVEWCRALLP